MYRKLELRMHLIGWIMMPAIGDVANIQPIAIAERVPRKKWAKTCPFRGMIWFYRLQSIIPSTARDMCF